MIHLSAGMDKIIIQKILLEVSPEEAFRLFTDKESLESWLTVRADVEAVPGGKYELFWDPDDTENNSTIGCKVLAVESPELINFEWKGPVPFKHFMNNARPLTNVTVTFIPRGDRTSVTLIHTGWRDSVEWEQARQYFVKAWSGAFEKLGKLVNSRQ